VGIAWPLATFALLAMAEVAPTVATGFAGTYALSSMLGGKAAADFVVRVLSGKVKPKAGAKPSAVVGSASTGTVLL
jgi:hypothetical protein